MAAEAQRLLDKLEDLEGLRDFSRSANCKRQFERLRVRGDAELHPADRGRIEREPIAIQLRDVGRGGAGFVCNCRLDAGSTWRLSFHHQGFVIGEQECVIRHCRPIGASLYLVGVQFVMSTGLLLALGVDPGATLDHTSGGAATMVEDEASFLPPADVA